MTGPSWQPGRRVSKRGRNRKRISLVLNPFTFTFHSSRGSEGKEGGKSVSRKGSSPTTSSITTATLTSVSSFFFFRYAEPAAGWFMSRVAHCTFAIFVLPPYCYSTFPARYSTYTASIPPSTSACIHSNRLIAKIRNRNFSSRYNDSRRDEKVRGVKNRGSPRVFIPTVIRLVFPI